MKACFIDLSTHLNGVDDLQARARGGMVTSLFRVTDYLAVRGHEVTVLAGIETPGVTQAGTRWVNAENFATDGAFDVLVSNRGAGAGWTDIKATRRVLWTHDLPHNGFAPDPRILRAYDAVVFMSRYAERVWRHFFANIGRSFLIPNGVDKFCFYPREKDPDYLIYISAPNRGLKRLPLILDAVKTRVRDSVRLRAYSNLAVLHPNEGQDTHEMDYKACHDSAVELCDPVPQPALAEELGHAALMVLPTGMPEICSNSILQSLASGTPVITTGNLGSAGEWVKRGVNGMLTEFGPQDYMIHTVEMVRHVVALLEAPKKLARLQRNAAATPLLSWNDVGDRWVRMFNKIGVKA